jgi:hypothetical protein
MSNINEHQIITDALRDYSAKNIHLKPNVRNSITIQSEHSKYTIKRYLLTPISGEDRERLFQLEGRYGVHPLDKLIGLSDLPFRMTVNAMLKVSKKAQEARSFQVASIDLNEDCDIKLDACTISDVTSHIGYLVFKNDIERAEKLNNLTINSKLSFPAVKKSGVLYLQIDGVLIHTREKKINDENDTGWREHKLGLVYNSDNILNVIRTNRHGKKENQHKILKKEYTSYIGSTNGFKKLFFENAYRNGYGTFKKTVMISDGAQWISTIVNEYFPDALHILDYYHVSEKIWDLGKLYYNNDKDKYDTWCTGICDEILESRYKNIRKEITKLEKSLKTTKVSSYLDKNTERIDYKSYLKSGYCIGSGAIEGSNKNIVQSRLKLSGMHWNRGSAQAVAILRCKKESNLWYSDVVIPVRKNYKLPCF